MKSKINVLEIFKRHKETLSYPDKIISKKDNFIFYTLPILFTFFCLIILRIPDNNTANIFATCLSIFIGLFLNLLVLILTFVENKFNISDYKNRLELVKQIFYNLSYTIVVSLIALGFLFISSVKIFPEKLKWGINISGEAYKLLRYKRIETNEIISVLFTAFFYFYLSKVMITLLMVIKRIFTLFTAEIEASNEMSEKNKIEEEV